MSASLERASTRARSMPLVTTRSRAAGWSRRRSARATASLTAMVRSAESPTATSSAGDVSGIVCRVTTKGRPSRRVQRSQVSARRSRVALLFTTSTPSRSVTSPSARASGPNRRKSRGTSSNPASRARCASFVSGRHPTSTRCPRRASWRLPGAYPIAPLQVQAAVDQLRRFLRPGDVAIDIGAHTGDTTLPIALAVGATGRVLGLEPNPYVFPVLECNASLNPAKTSILPLNFAAMRTDGFYEFQYGEEGYCNGGFHEGMSKWLHGSAFKVRVEGRNVQAFL